jgi:acrylyl-CoA reductase (NADPH)
MSRMPESFRAYMLLSEGPQRGQFMNVTLDDLDPGDVLVRVAYSSINYKDALAATGRGRILRRPSCIGGIDFSGIVVASGNPRFSEGDAVIGTGFDLGVAHHGGYAEYARVNAEWLVPLPAGLSLHDAMALGTAGFTAALAIMRMERNGLTPRKGPVVVSGATGGVGSIAIAALAPLGYAVTALTGRPHEREYLSTLGAGDILDRSALDLSAIKPLGKATWAGGVDNLGGAILAWMLSTMETNGVVAAIGLAQDAGLQTTVMPFILRGVSLLGINSSDSPSPAERLEVWRRLAADLRPRTIDRITQTLAFDDLPAAFAQLMAGTARGRRVVEVRP